jgi:hypothetical protein
VLTLCARRPGAGFGAGVADRTNKDDEVQPSPPPSPGASALPVPPPHLLSARHPRATETARRLERLCFALGVLLRRALFDAVAATTARDSRYFVLGLYQLFRGHVAVTLPDDEALLLLRAPWREAMRTAARQTVVLVQETYQTGDDLSDEDELARTLRETVAPTVIFPETDAGWTRAVKADEPVVLSMRQRENESTRALDHSFMRLTLQDATWRLVRLNREGVRAMWAAQQQELIYIGNRNEERGSIQQMRATARNLVTQACDLPVGYPIYVSGLVTSHASAPSPLHAAGWQAAWRTLTSGVQPRPPAPPARPSRSASASASASANAHV